jgi:prolyl 4-hydroxylase
MNLFHITLLFVSTCEAFVIQRTKSRIGGNYLHQSLLKEPELTSFWGETRSDDEIVEYCARALFDDDIEKTKENIEIISNELPLILIHNFMSNKDCGEIKDAGIRSGLLKRSTTGESQDTSTDRTSSTAWLRDDECLVPLQKFRNRVANLVGLDSSFQENTQVVQYEPGQKFNLHTDHQESFNELECRGRLATVLLYLNSSNDESSDGVEDIHNPSFDGGETYFPEYETNVIPKRGSACFWFNTVERPGVSNYNPLAPLTLDIRSRHAGNPVISGTKWICNLWTHPIEINF